MVSQVDAKTLLEAYSIMQHSELKTGTIGFNINVNNLLAGVFIAAGQDVACVGESGSAQLIITPASKEEIESHGKINFKVYYSFHTCYCPEAVWRNVNARQLAL